MIGTIRQIAWIANRHAAEILLAGLTLVVWRNLRLWRRDQASFAGGTRTEPRLPLEEWRGLPSVSVLVAAWNEAETIRPHLESFLGLRYPRKELVLCAGGGDGTYAVARSYTGPALTVIEQQPGEGKQRALRRCLERSRGDVVFLTDADCLLDDDSFERTLAPIANEGEDASTGTNAPLDEQLAASSFVRSQWAVWFYRGNVGRTHVSGLLGRNAAVTRRALLDSGGFSQPVASGTDRFLAGALNRAGYRIRYVGDSWIRTHYETDARKYARQQARWLRNLVVHGISFDDFPGTVHGAATMLFGLGAVTTALLTPLLGRAAATGLALAIAHATISRARYFDAARRARGEGWPIPWAGLLGHVLLDVLAWATASVQLVTKESRTTW